MANDPLLYQFPIVDAAGRPVLEFQRKYNDLAVAVNRLAAEIANAAANGGGLTLEAHAEAVAVHGALGAVVGTDNVQILSNKTLAAPSISSPSGLVKADVGLGNVDNTSDATKNSAAADLTNKALRGITLSLADDIATTIAIPGGGNGILVLVGNGTPAATVIIGIFYVVGTSALAPVSIYINDATRLSLGTTTLSDGAGDGVDNNLNLNSPGTGFLHVKNRYGAARAWGYTWISSAL